MMKPLLKAVSNPLHTDRLLMIVNEEVHLWYGINEISDARLPFLSRMLSETEQAQAGRYHFTEDQHRFVIRRSMLRLLIGRYLTADPKEIRFTRNQYGKPFVASGHRTLPLMFNISHSNHAVLYGFTLGRRIGVDIEFVKPIPDMEAIAEKFFSRKERTELMTLPEDRRRDAFYHCWTQKEAFVKALGEGLSRDLDQFDVSVSPDSPAVLRRTAWDEEEAGRWSLASMKLLPGYQAALAVEGSGWTLKHHRLTAGCFPLQP